jgi:hypothetical protein
MVLVGGIGEGELGHGFPEGMGQLLAWFPVFYFYSSDEGNARGLADASPFLFFSSTVIKLTVYFELEKIQKNKFGLVVFLEN